MKYLYIFVGNSRDVESLHIKAIPFNLNLAMIIPVH